MLYMLLYPLHASFPPLNVFKYITFRTLLAGLTALTLSLLLGPALIRVRQAWRMQPGIHRPPGNRPRCARCAKEQDLCMRRCTQSKSS